MAEPLPIDLLREAHRELVEASAVALSEQWPIGRFRRRIKTILAAARRQQALRRAFATHCEIKAHAITEDAMAHGMTRETYIATVLKTRLFPGLR